MSETKLDLGAIMYQAKASMTKLAKEEMTEGYNETVEALRKLEDYVKENAGNLTSYQMEEITKVRAALINHIDRLKEYVDPDEQEHWEEVCRWFSANFSDREFSDRYLSKCEKDMRKIVGEATNDVKQIDIILEDGLKPMCEEFIMRDYLWKAKDLKPYELNRLGNEASKLFYNIKRKFFAMIKRASHTKDLSFDLNKRVMINMIAFARRINSARLIFSTLNNCEPCDVYIRIARNKTLLELQKEGMPVYYHEIIPVAKEGEDINADGGIPLMSAAIGYFWTPVRLATSEYFTKNPTRRLGTDIYYGITAPSEVADMNVEAVKYITDRKLSLTHMPLMKAGDVKDEIDKIIERANAMKQKQEEALDNLEKIDVDAAIEG